MISGTGSASSIAGEKLAFTLLEMLIVLGILALFAGFFALKFDGGNAEKTLSEISGELRAEVLRAKNRSSTFRRDQFVLLTNRFFETSERIADQDRFGDNEAAERFPIPQSVEIEWQTPNSSKWQRDPPFLWRFRSSGLSDPVSVRFMLDDSYTILRFGVLTGIAEEETVIQ